jgi:hypothetical protein
MGPPVRREDPVDPAAEELYGAPLSQFTAVRKRLADALRAEGDRSLAARVAALARPALPAWVVNQLWRRARRDMEALFAAGQRMRSGEAGAWQEQRAVLARLGAAAVELLRGDKHAPSPATLRRVTSTLLSLSALGSFAPDPAGRLVADRDPPGFEVLGDDEESALAAAVAGSAAPAPDGGSRAAARARGRIADKAAAKEDKDRARAEARATIEQARAAARDKAERERVAEKARGRAASIGKTIDRLRAEIDELEEKLGARRDALREAEAERDAALREAERALPKKKTSRS